VYAEASTSRGYTRITSPIAGTVSVRDLRVGEVAGPRRAFQVVDMGRLRVIVRLPEKDLARIREGLAVQLAGAYDEEARATGKVLRVSPVVDAGTGTVRVTVAVDPGQTALRPGQFVKVRVEVDRHSGVLTIPRRALDWEDGEPVAWTVVEAKKRKKGEDDKEDKEGEDGEDKEPGAPEEPGLLEGLFGGEEEGEGAEPRKDPWEGIPRREAKRLPLEIGYQDPDRVEVLKGMEAGEQVVVLGHNNLREGSPVRLPDDPMPALEEADQGEDKP
jgi:multidrug efflux pump subunit AcrA (membrane-fusion protein)